MFIRCFSLPRQWRQWTDINVLHISHRDLIFSQATLKNYFGTDLNVRDSNMRSNYATAQKNGFIFVFYLKVSITMSILVPGSSGRLHGALGFEKSKNIFLLTSSFYGSLKTRNKTRNSLTNSLFLFKFLF